MSGDDIRFRAINNLFSVANCLRFYMALAMLLITKPSSSENTCMGLVYIEALTI